MIFIELQSYRSLLSHQVWNFNSTESSSAENNDDLLDVPKICPILKLKFETMDISVRKMLVSPDSRKMNKSFVPNLSAFMP